MFIFEYAPGRARALPSISTRSLRNSLVAQIPSDTEDDDFVVEMAAFEEFVHVAPCPSDPSFDQFCRNYARSSRLHQSLQESRVGVPPIEEKAPSRLGTQVVAAALGPLSRPTILEVFVE